MANMMIIIMVAMIKAKNPGLQELIDKQFKTTRGCDRARFVLAAKRTRTISLQL